jgi:hypothetical protein
MPARLDARLIRRRSRHHGALSRIAASILSPLSTACASTIGTRTSGVAGTGSSRFSATVFLSIDATDASC